MKFENIFVWFAIKILLFDSFIYVPYIVKNNIKILMF